MCFGFVSKHLGSRLGLFIPLQSHLPLNTITIMLWSYEVGCFFGWLSIFKKILGHILTFGCILWYYTVFCCYICSPKGHWDITFLALALWHCIDKNVINKTRLEVTCPWSQVTIGFACICQSSPDLVITMTTKTPKIFSRTVCQSLG